MAPKQLELSTWGGRRKGAGRKPAGRLRRVSHKKRPQHVQRFPLHAFLRTREEVPRLRAQEIFTALRSALEAGAERAGFRLVHYSVQGNHLHLIVEAEDARALSRGMQGLAVRIAREPGAADGRLCVLCSGGAALHLAAAHRVAAQQGRTAPRRLLGGGWLQLEKADIVLERGRRGAGSTANWRTSAAASGGSRLRRGVTREGMHAGAASRFSAP